MAVKVNITPNMGLPNPVPEQQDSPEWAQNIQDCFNIIDAVGFTGAPNDGKQITTAGINIDDDLSLNAHNLDNVRAVAFANLTSQPSELGDVAISYVENGDLWYKDQSGNAIQLTVNGSINVGATNTTYSFLSVSGNLTLGNSDGYVFLAVDTTANRTITLPTCITVAQGRRYIIVDSTGTASTHPITITRASTDTINGALTYVIRDNFGGVELVGNGASSWKAQTLFQKSGGFTLDNAVAIQARKADNSASISLISLDSANLLTVGDSTYPQVVVKSSALTLEDGTGTSFLSPNAVEFTGDFTFEDDNGGNLTFGVNLGGISNSFGPMTFSETVGAGLSHDKLSGNGANSGATLTIKAQQGQNVASGTNNSGGLLVLGGGNVGTGGSNGSPGAIAIHSASGVAQSGLIRCPDLTPWSSTLLAVRNSGNTGDLILLSQTSVGDLTLGDPANTNTATIAGFSGIKLNVANAALGSFTTSGFFFDKAFALPIISQSGQTASSTAGIDFTVQAQNTSSATGAPNGGTLNLQGGTSNAGIGGSVHLKGGSSTSGTNGSINIQTGAGAGTAGTISLTVGTSTVRLSANGTGLGLYATSPVAQATRVGQLTDSSAGTPGTTLSAIVGTTYATDAPTLRNWAASLAAKLNAIELALHNLGVTA